GVSDGPVEMALQQLNREPEGQTYARRLRSTQRALLQLRDEVRTPQDLALGDEAAVRGVLDAAMDQLLDADPEARRRAVHRLSGLGGAEAAAALIRALDDPAAQVRSSAAVSLGGWRPWKRSL